MYVMACDLHPYINKCNKQTKKKARCLAPDGHPRLTCVNMVHKCAIFPHLPTSQKNNEVKCALNNLILKGGLRKIKKRKSTKEKESFWKKSMAIVIIIMGNEVKLTRIQYIIICEIL